MQVACSSCKYFEHIIFVSIRQQGKAVEQVVQCKPYTSLIFNESCSCELILQVAAKEQTTFTDLVAELTQNCASDLEKAR